MYKYLPLRSAFFENYYLRATQRVALNDPFEILPSRRWMEQAFLERNQRKYTGSFSSLLSKITKMNLNDVGIISVASRNDNILMWSHYADNHRGMVVEIDEKNIKMRERFGVQDGRELAENVIYRKGRVCNFEGDNIFLPHVQKALEWSYEEEKRIIVPNLHECDRWMYVFPSEKEAQSACIKKEVHGIKVNCCKRSGKAISFRANDIKKPFHPFQFVNNANFMSMFRIPPEAIKSVAFGVNADMELVCKVRNVIDLNTNLRHIKISKAMLSESDFAIEFIHDDT